MSKTKMRCNTCGKWFQSANAKDLTCPDCLQKARKEKMAAKTAPPAITKSTTAATPPKVVAPPQKKKNTGHWFDSVDDVKVAEPEQPRPKPTPPRDTRTGSEATLSQTEALSPNGQHTQTDEERQEGQRNPNYRGPGGYREEGQRNPNYRGPGGYREDGERNPNYRSPGNYRGPGGYREEGARPRQPMEGGFGRGPRTDRPPRPTTGPRDGGVGSKPRPKKAQSPKPATPPKPKREKIPPPPPFVPTEEQIQQVEERYIALATPTEYDGIRTQIAQELSIPKKAVKTIVKNLRDRQQIPSWWEAQTYKGSSEELERIKEAYMPLLPVPAVGIHKEIADKLELKPGVTYQAIKAIRHELNLPQYNDPALHEEELAEIRRQREEQQARRKAEQDAKKGEQQATQAGNEAKAEQDKSNEVQAEQSVAKSEQQAEPEKKSSPPQAPETPVAVNGTSSESGNETE